MRSRFTADESDALESRSSELSCSDDRGGQMKVEEMIDDRILKRIDETGFIEGLSRTYGTR